jgi:hypothetical protein
MMRKVFFILLFFLLSVVSYSQNVYYGYPLLDEDLSKGDRVILNVPDNVDGRFIQSLKLNNLIKFINKYNNIELKVEINVFYGSSEFSSAYSKKLCEDLQKILSKECEEMNYRVVSNGRNNPIFFNKSDPVIYEKINTRIEIKVD